MSAQLVVNEILYDPAPTTTPTGTQNGDANGDGTRDASDDEFIEFVNSSATSLDISGYKIYDAARFGDVPDNPRHEVPAGTVIPAGEKYVVFGGGDVSAIDGIAGVIAQTASSGSLGLTNSSEVVTVTDFNDNVIFSFDADDFNLNSNSDESLARSPDITGPFRHHFFIDGTRHSPGEDNGTSIFSNTFELIANEYHADPDGTLAGDANGDGTRDPADDEFIEFINTTGAPVDISGYKIYDFRGFEEGTANHVVPAGTVIPDNGFYVLFGGGTPTGTFGGATVQTASNTVSNLSLTNGGDSVFIEDASGTVVFTFDTSELNDSWGGNEAVTRDPDITGSFVLHSSLPSGLLYSPGTLNDATTLSNQSFDQLGFKMYPNPVSDGILHIKTPNQSNKNVELFDVTGKRVLKTQIQTDLLNVNGIDSGIYIIKISTKSGVASSKLIIK